MEATHEFWSLDPGSVAKKSSFQNVPTFVIKTYLCFYTKRWYVLKRTIFLQQTPG